MRRCPASPVLHHHPAHVDHLAAAEAGTTLHDLRAAGPLTAFGDDVHGVVALAQPAEGEETVLPRAHIVIIHITVAVDDEHPVVGQRPLGARWSAGHIALLVHVAADLRTAAFSGLLLAARDQYHHGAEQRRDPSLHGTSPFGGCKLTQFSLPRTGPPPRGRTGRGW